MNLWEYRFKTIVSGPWAPLGGCGGRERGFHVTLERKPAGVYEEAFRVLSD